MSETDREDLRVASSTVPIRVLPAPVASGSRSSVCEDAILATDAPTAMATFTAPSAAKKAASPAPRRTSRTSPLKEKLRIDVNSVSDAPMGLASPLGLFAAKKLPSNTHRSHPVSMFTSAEMQVNPQLYESPFLEYGMIVSLSCDERNGLIAAEGFSSRDVRLERLNHNVDFSGAASKLGLGGLEERRMFAEGGFRFLDCPFRDCLFEVMPKMTYDATLALETMLRDEQQDSTAPALNQRRGNFKQDEHSKLVDLKFKSESERRLNATMYKKLHGTQVIYGHVRSKYSCRAVRERAIAHPFLLGYSTETCEEWAIYVPGYAGYPIPRS